MNDLQKIEEINAETLKLIREIICNAYEFGHLGEAGYARGVIDSIFSVIARADDNKEWLKSKIKADN